MSEQNEDYHMSKKERREQKKEAQRDAARSERKKQSMKSWLLWGGLVLIIGAILIGVSIAARQDNPDVNSGADLTVEGPVDGEWTVGGEGAAVSLIEYSDFQCPACRSYFSVLNEVKKAYGDNISFTYRHYPLRQIHEHAQLAGQAAEAAGVQGKFWEMHDLLFEKQNEWSNGTFQKRKFIGYAEDLGLNTEQFEEDLNSSESKQKVNAGYNSGIRAGVNSTPSFFLNGQRIRPGGTPQSFNDLIDAEFERLGVDVNYIDEEVAESNGDEETIEE
jgi:protein-disulfide isomerase